VSGSPLPRRGLLLSAGALAAVALGGCEFDPTSPAPATPAPPDPDLAVVLRARAELTGLITRLGTGPGVASLVAAHRVQLTALGGRPPAPTTRTRPLGRAEVVAREHRAADRFTHWAETCERGDLARVLASVAAGIRMQPVLRGSA
jgi:hypothetical protein